MLLVNDDVEVRNYYGWVTPSSDKDIIRVNGIMTVSSGRPSLMPRPKCDLDGHHLHQMFAGHFTLISKGVHFTNVEIPVGSELGGLRNSTVLLKDSIVEVFLKNKVGGTIGSRWKYFRSLVDDHNSLRLRSALKVTDWWCERNEGISCPYGAVYLERGTIQWSPDYGWKMKRTLIKFVQKSEFTISISKAFLLAIERMKNYIYIPYNLELDFGVCKQSPVVTNTTVYDPSRSLPPHLVINFQGRLYGCLEVYGKLTVRVADFILRNIFSDRAWPVVFPFIYADPGANIILENVIIEMDTDATFHSNELKGMVKRIRNRARPNNLGEGDQKIEVWHPKDCLKYLQNSKSCKVYKRCPKEAECPAGAIFIEDASFTIEEGDGNNDLGIGVHYHIRHSLITVVRGELPPPRTIKEITNKSEAHEFVSESNKRIETSSRSFSMQFILVALFVVLGVMSIFLVLCAFLTYRRGFRTKTPSQVQMQHGISMLPAVTVVKQNQVSDVISVDAEIPADLFALKGLETLENYQQTANKLLGSVTLGPLLGAGSFGKVFKATWNGATVAVKVVVHDGITHLKLSAQREASLSSDLHHPNIVRTFLQTAREIKADDTVPTPRTPDQASTSRKREALPTPCEHEDIEERHQQDAGYFNLNQIINDHHRTRPNPFGSLDHCSDDGRSVENYVADRKETWMIQEFCDMGSLEKAIRKGKFMQGNELDMLLVVETCIDICRGMLYLNNRNVIHGDLKSCNILLNGSLYEEKGFIAKVADFGLSRELGMHASHITTQTTGTVTHMPPELFKEEKMTAASDVYSFGIVMWEIVSKESPLEGVPHVLIIKKIVYDSWRPTFSEGTPSCYIKLAKECWEEDSTQRPSIQQVLTELEEMKILFLEEDYSSSFDNH